MNEVVLAWTPSDIEDIGPTVPVVALTAEAFMAAKMRENSPLDLGVLLRADQPLESTSLRLLNDLHAVLSSSPKSWLEAYSNVSFGVQAYQFLVWLQLLRTLRARLGIGTCIHLPKVFLDSKLQEGTFIYGLAQESLLVACRVTEREGLRFPGLDKIGSSAGRRLVIQQAARSSMPLLPLMYRAWSKEKRIRRSTLAAMAPVKVLLITQQYNDAVHAIPFAKHLKARYGSAFRWIGILPKKNADLTTEEASLICGQSLDQLGFLDSREIDAAAHEDWLKSRLLDSASAWEVAGVLAQRAEVSVRRRDWFELVNGTQYSGIASRASVWRSVLERAQPKVIVGLSALQDMALVRGWARRKKVPFVSLMHGAFPGLWRCHDVDADYLGVFGKILSEFPINPTLVRPRRIVSCGPMQFADKAMNGFKLVSPSCQARNDILFLGSFESLPFAPVTPEEQWQIISDVHRACCAAGRSLRLRAHPRFPITWTPYVDELARRHPGTINTSTEPSISRDLSSCVFAISSHFDGAVMDAMLAGTPVLSYIRSGVSAFERHKILESTGGLIRDFDSLKEILNVGSSDEKWILLRDEQQRFLEKYFDQSQKDPWARAVDLVQLAIDEAGA